MKDWGPLGEIITLAYAVIGAFAVLWLVGVFWLALRTVACAVAAVRIAVGSGGQHLSRAPPEEWLTLRLTAGQGPKSSGQGASYPARAHLALLRTASTTVPIGALAVSVSSHGAVLTWRTLDTERTQPRGPWRACTDGLSDRWFEGRRWARCAD